MTTGPAATDLIQAARQCTPLIRTHADETERDRRLAAPVIEALRSAGLFTMGLPTALGGRETSLETAMRAIEEVACADGATGWNVMIAFDTGLMSAFLHAPAIRTFIASFQQPILAASTAPSAHVQHRDGGYLLSGRWRFGSGCQQADLFLAGAMLYDGEAPVLDEHALPVRLRLLLQASDVEILDTWHVSGLRGTGSHDYTVNDLFVAERFVEPWNNTLPAERGPLYAISLFASFALVKAAVVLGIARHALDALTELAQRKTPTGQTNVLRERAAVQADVARAEALVRAGRAFLYETVGEVWQTVATGQPATAEQQALLRLAAVDGVQRAIQAVDLMYSAGGATAIYASSPLERCFRDVHVVPTHMVVQPTVYEAVGRVFLGLPPGTIIW